MLGPDSFSSAVAAPMVRYLQHKQALGRRYTAEYYILRSLDRFLAQGQSSDLTALSFLRWCDTQKHLASGVRRAQMRVVRGFCLHRRRSDPNGYVPPVSLFPPEHQRRAAYIFSETEIARLLQESGRLYRIRHSPLRPEAMRLAVVLLYCAGLRLGELLRLELKDYEPKERILQVRASKFHKSRQLPLSTDACAEIEQYLALRSRLNRPVRRARKLIWNGSEQADGYSRGRLRFTMWQLLDRAGIRTSDGRRPTIHCLRHTFAVHALLRWYRTGVEVQAKLPHLATYMGHVSVASTQEYLQFIGELMSVASDRFGARSERLLGLPSESEGGRS
jgi:integrase/recombinase XerD